MVTYVINYTDNTKTSIDVDEKTIDQNLPIALFGRQKLEYGELMNENLLHLLENFACPEDPNNQGNPDPERMLDNTLQNPTEGMLWYNSTPEKQMLYVYQLTETGGVWVPLSTFGEIAANYGTISDGNQLPKPVSSTGYTFEYDECSWIVGPHDYPGEIDYMVCYSSTEDARVTMQYRVTGSSSTVSGVANYMIVGIKGNANQGENPLGQGPQITPTKTPAPTATPTATFGVTPTMTPTQTVTPDVTPPVTVTPSNTPTQTPPESAPLLAQNTKLHARPTPADPGIINPMQALPASQTSYDHMKTSCSAKFKLLGDPPNFYWDECSDVGTSAGVGRKAYLWLDELTGGVPPYTVAWNLRGDATEAGNGSFSFGGGTYTGSYDLPSSLQVRFKFYINNTETRAYGFSGIHTETGVPSGRRLWVELDTYYFQDPDTAYWWPTCKDPWTYPFDQPYYVTYSGLWIECSGTITVTDSVGQQKIWTLPAQNGATFVTPLGPTGLLPISDVPRQTGSGIWWAWRHQGSCRTTTCNASNGGCVDDFSPYNVHINTL